MKKEEFFARIRVALAGMDEETAGDILSEFETHFQEGFENGKTEEEICEELGNIEELEEAFRGENPAAVGRPVYTQIEKVSSDVIEESIYNRQYPGIQRVQAQLVWADINVIKSADNYVGLHVSGRLAEDLQKLKEQLIVSVYGGCLTLRQEKGRRKGDWMRNFFGGIESSKEELHIELALPDCLKELQSSTVSGDVEITGIRCRSLSLETVSGDIGIKAVCADSCKIGSKSGDVRAEGIRAERVDMHTVSGDVKVKNNSVVQIGIKSVSGDIKLEEKTAEKADIQSTSGEICADFVSPSDCLTRSVSGDCRIRIAAKTTLEAFSTSGEIHVYYTGGIGLAVKIGSTSGSLETDCHGHRQKGRWSIDSVFGEPDSRVKASTVSGDIMVKDYE